MAAIYDAAAGQELTAGLQGCNTCDEAILAAEWLADERGEDVLLVDDDGEWLVHPQGADGRRQLASAVEDDDGGERVSGPPPALRGDVSGLRGDMSALRGEVSPDLRGTVSGLRGEVSPALRGEVSPALRGDVSGLWGEVSGLCGNVDECELTDADRAAGVDVRALVAELNGDAE